MKWLLVHYVLHALVVLVAVGWAVQTQRKWNNTTATIRVLARMIDRELDDIREERANHTLKVTLLLEEIRQGVEILLDQKGKDRD